MPEVLTKLGGLTGFSTEIVLVPALQLGVVVLVNSDTGTPASTLALDIAHNLVFSLRRVID